MSTPFLHNPQFDPSPFFYKGGEKAILLIHGFTATPHEVRHLANNLHRAGFTVAGPLLPGHGTTPASLNKTRWQDWYTAVETKHKELSSQYQKVFVGGESLGGLLALLLAARDPQISGVMAYTPALINPMTRAQEIQLFTLSPFIESTPKGDLEGNTTWQGYKVNPLKAVQQLRSIQKVVREELKNIRQPLLVFQGKKDATIDQSSAEIVFNSVSSVDKNFTG